MNLDTEIIKMVITQGIFCALFVWLFYDTRKESKEREDKLMTYLEKTEEAHGLILTAINELESGGK